MSTITEIEPTALETPVLFTLTDYTTLPLAGAGAPRAAQAIDTFGWDTVSAIRLPDVNKAIEKAGSSPSGFDSTGDSGARGVGTFGDWTVVQGGSGTLLMMQLPLPSGTVTFSGTDYPYEQAVARIEVRLQFLPRDTGSTTSGAQELRLLGQDHSASDAQKPVAVEALEFHGPTPPAPLVPPFLRETLEKWLIENLEEFNHVFSTVSLGDRADKEDLQWLKPTSVGYAYEQPSGSPDDEDCIFAVLAMTENRSSAGLPEQVSPDLIPEGQRAGFMIGGERYLEKAFRPGIADMFEEASPDDFVLEGRELKNGKALRMKKIGQWTPSIEAEKFSAELNYKDQLVISIRNAHVQISPGIDLYLDYTMYLGAKLIDRKDGTKAFVLYDAKDLDHHHVVQTAAWVTITASVASLITSVVLAAIGGTIGSKLISKPLTQCVIKAGEEEAASLTQKVIVFIIKAIVGSITGGIAAALGWTPEAIAPIIAACAERDAENLPKFDPFADEATAAVDWPNATGAKPTSVAFNGGLQIGIDPIFVD